MKNLSINGEAMIFKGKFGYSTTISNQDIEGNWDKMYIDVQLPKGHELENRTHILVNNGFLSFKKDKTGLPKIKVVIMDYMVIGNTEEELPF